MKEKNQEHQQKLFQANPKERNGEPMKMMGLLHHQVPRNQLALIKSQFKGKFLNHNRLYLKYLS